MNRYSRITADEPQEFRAGALCRWVVLLCALIASGAHRPGQAQQPANTLQPHARAWEQLLAAEDARARTPAQLSIILETSRSAEPELRRLAVRALGRLERAELADTVAARLRDPNARVRAEAAHALGQALSRSAPGAAAGTLIAALGAERDPAVRAALAETLGRLRYANASDARAASTTLTRELDGAGAMGAARGLYFLARQVPVRSVVATDARAALLRLATRLTSATDPAAVHLRTVSAAALILSGAADAAALSAILGDGNAFVRREAAAALVTFSDSAAGAPLVLRALRDASGVVRFEGLRAYARRLAATRGCDPVLAALRDTHAHTALLAIDLLGTTCPASPRSIAVLDSIAGSLPTAREGAWHAPARALVSLAGCAPDRARARLPRFAEHSNFFVRTYAATAAGALRDTATLLQLSRDQLANVRTASIEALQRVLRRAGDSVYIAQLSQDDSQVLMSAATALDSSAHPGAPVALLDALDRITRARRETSRDARDALLARARQLGNASLADRLRPYLRDFDPQIAARAADALQAWTGTRPEPQPSAPPALRLPSFEDVAQLSRSRALLQFQQGEVELEVFPFDAPTNATRFAELARAGYFNGLTLHRNAPNFVVQGGSPNANEYAGDGPFTRDELGLENRRGTVGLSTRGRDTGDGQLYINLIDNVRLDHDYTVYARVVRGMDVVDRLLEGALIQRVLIISNR